MPAPAPAPNDVDAIQASSQSLVASQFAQIQTFLNALQGFLSQDTIVVDDIPIEGHFLDVEVLQQTLDALDTNWPPYGPNTTALAPPPSPTVVTVDTVTVENAPQFTTLAPNPLLPDAPAVGSFVAPNAPAVGNVAAPAAPSISIPSPPTFSPIALPEAADVQIDAFSFATPISDLTAPTNIFTFNEQDYSSALSDAVKAKLIVDIENGGYGIDVDDERALWDRARDRSGAEANQAIVEALDTAGSRGFPFPTGADYALVVAAQAKSLATIAGMDREIALKRADMYVENRKVTLQLANEVEQMFIQYRSAMMERALNAAKALVELGIAVFNAKRDKYLADLEAFKTYAQVYAEKIRGELAKVEIYKAKVDAARIAGELQRVQAEVYATQVQAVNATIEIYKGQLAGAKLALDFEHSKIDLYRTQVEAFTATVQAKTAEFGLYESRLKGVAAQIDIFETQVKAYNAQVAGYSAKVQAAGIRASAQAAAANANTQNYVAQVEKYRADISKYVSDTNANVEIFRGNIAGYAARAGALEKKAEVVISANAANNAAYAKQTDQQIAVVQSRTRDLLHLLDSRINAAKFGVDSTTAIAVAVANQIVGLTSLLKSE